MARPRLVSGDGPSPQALREPANMSTVTTASPVRHGLCGLTLRIGGTDYRLRPLPAPAGFRSVWTLRKLDPEATAVTYSVAVPRGEPAGCTCPDHRVNGAICKHVMALRALRLIPRGRRLPGESARRAPSRKALRVHDPNARVALATVEEGG